MAVPDGVQFFLLGPVVRGGYVFGQLLEHALDTARCGIAIPRVVTSPALANVWLPPGTHTKPPGDTIDRLKYTEQVGRVVGPDLKEVAASLPPGSAGTRTNGDARDTGVMSGVFPSGAAVAVSLSFDDARASQLEAIGVLQEYGIRASFYVLPTGVAAAPECWRAVALSGHEIGNHTRTHPCSANFEFSRANALEDKTMRDIATDIDAASQAIQDLLGVQPKTFAYPCGQSFIGRRRQRRSYVPLVAERFVAGRGYASETGNLPERCDLAHLEAYVIDGLDAGALQSLVDAGMIRGEWVIMVGHDIGQRGSQTVPVGELDRFCRRVSHDDRVWIAPVLQVAERIRSRRQADNLG